MGSRVLRSIESGFRWEGVAECGLPVGRRQVRDPDSEFGKSAEALTSW